MFHGVHFRQYPVGIQIQIWDGCRFHSAVVPVATSNRIAEIVNFAEAFPPQSCIQEREREGGSLHVCSCLPISCLERSGNCSHSRRVHWQTDRQTRLRLNKAKRPWGPNPKAARAREQRQKEGEEDRVVITV